MARKTAIHVTQSELAAEEYRRGARLDATRANGREPTTLDIIRAARDQMSEKDLLTLARSAARLELRGANFDAEDRADCTGELVWHILAETDGAPPRRASDHATLTYLCGLASNWRRALVRRRAAEDRARQEREDAYSQSAAAVYDAIDARTYELDAHGRDVSDYLTVAADQDVKTAHATAADVVDRLELPRGGAVYAAIYQWSRDATAEICAADNGVSVAAWEQRAARGKRMIRAAYPDPGDLIDALGQTGPVSVYRGVSLEWRAREGTDQGSRPTRPVSAEDARQLCLMRHQCPTPGLAAIGKARIRRGYFVAAPNVGWSPLSNAPRGFIRVLGKSEKQHRADAIRNLARAELLSR